MIGFLVEGVIFWDMYKRRNTAEVLGQTVEAETSPTQTPTTTPTVTATPTVTVSPTSTPTTTPEPTITPVPQPDFTSEEIYNFIERFASQYGVSPDILRYMALCESGFRPKAKNSIYSGLYQFDSSTWKRFRLEMGEDSDPALRLNAEEAVQTAAYVLHLNKAYIWPNCIP